MITVRELLADAEAVIKFFEGIHPDHTVRLSTAPGAVDVVTDAPEGEDHGNG